MTQGPSLRVRAGLAAGAVIVALGWVFIEDSTARRQNWEGTIIKTHKSRNWWHYGRRQYSRSRYTYYWDVASSDGKSLTTKVPYGTWEQSKAGDGARKIGGERWPRLLTTKAEEQRKMAERFF